KLDQSGIKALLQNSTVAANEIGDTRLTRQGVGVLRVDRASRLSSYATPAGISFGRLNPLVPVHRDERVTLRNLATAGRTYVVEHIANRSYPGVDVNCPSTVRVGAN